MDLAYNLFVAAITLGWLWWARREPRPRRRRLAALGLIAVVFVAAAGSGSLFGCARLLSYALFVYGPVAALGLALLCWGRQRVRSLFLIALALAVWAVGVDAFLVEPERLEVSHFTITTPRISRPVRVVLLADLQTDRIGAYERGVLERIRAERPDLVVLAGDYVQHAEASTRRALMGRLATLIASVELSAPLGVYAVEGNTDHDDWVQVFAGSSVVATATTQTFDLGELELVALSMSDSFRTDLRLSPRGEKFRIVLGHAPDFALSRAPADLLLAGHTHGGQIRLPFFGPLLTFSKVPRAWAAGKTELAAERTLIVSRGVGMERGDAPRLRFLCRPELVVIDLTPAPAD